MSIQAKYNHQKIEDKWYSYWIKNDYFSSKPDKREPYTIVIPPPNITGVLHMGHMLNNTIQDILIRRARLLGKNACWVPGTDHASIATEAKVVEKLKSNGIEKNDISREEFMEYAWEWKNEFGNIILDQLKKIGCSCDWNRTTFTLDDKMNKSVLKVFIDLYNKGLIYRGYRMVNWDPEAKTTLSDEEVNFVEKNDNLYYVKYKIIDSDNHVTIATTRPETILGDSAICVNPKDKRYKEFIGRSAIVPIVNRHIPIIADEYVDIEYGTGCLKVTPAHDHNDKLLGEKHNLEFIDILNDDASLNDICLHYSGMDRFDAREKIIDELDSLGLFVKKENITHNVGVSERTGSVIEPKFSHQWFLKMEDLVKPAIKSVLKSEDIKFFPKKFDNTFRNWMENIRDWNISRQLYWGHQIPVFYYGDENKDYVVAENIDLALEQVRKKTNNNNITLADLTQDEDVLDTWFSSWLWPISVFDGINNPENDEVNYYYPTNDLVTGPDIIFFWVSRMIMAGYQFRDNKPFNNVYFTGIVRDKQRRKMSKSLGNSPDALKLIDDYSADGVRVGLMLSSAAGNDLLFDESLCDQGKSFSNKIWNSLKLIKGWEVVDTNQPDYCSVTIDWYNQKFNSVLNTINDHFSKFRISDALMCIYKLIWDDFCSVLLEIIKPQYGQPIDEKTHRDLIKIFEKNLIILHPFMPFITEEIWHLIAKRKSEEAIIISSWPEFDTKLPIDTINDFEALQNIISGIRNIRKKYQISFKESLNLSVVNNDNFSKNYDSIIKKICNIKDINYVDSEIKDALSFRVESNIYSLPFEKEIDFDEEIKKIKEDLDYQKGFLKSVNSKLENKRFTDNAPDSIVQNEIKKKNDAISKISVLEERLKKLER
ncbi:MAG: valine--tRNA ligase [Flavobacteriales bacterium]|nr:MAG: valine--tRNA ligase [Flavobacteriales bacterium]